MSLAVFALVALATPPRPMVVDIQTQRLPSGVAVRVVSTASVEAEVRREADAVVLLLPADAGPRLRRRSSLPTSPAVTVARRPLGLEVRIAAPARLAHELRRSGSVITIVLTEPGAPAVGDPQLHELYRRILPPPSAPVDQPLSGGSGGQVVPADGGEDAMDGFVIGRMTVRPELDVAYVDAEAAFLDTAEPLHDGHYMLRPLVRATGSLSTVRLTASYEARLRRGGSIDQVDSTTHVADGTVSVPIGAFLRLALAEHFATGVLETQEVDPGREFFFRLGRFTTWQHSASLRYDPGGRVGGEMSASLAQIRMDDRAAYFDHDEETVGGALTYDVGPNVRTGLRYSFHRIPLPSERPEAYSYWHDAAFEVSGEIIPLVTGQANVGYRELKAPLAEEGGRLFRGVTVGARLTKEFSPSFRLTLVAQRSTEASFFERNAFYIVNHVGLEALVPLPFGLSFSGGVGYHQNDYRIAASSLGEPRQDKLSGWSLGFGRSITRWTFLRADYRREQRDSNLDAFDSRSTMFTIQLGFRPFASATP